MHRKVSTGRERAKLSYRQRKSRNFVKIRWIQDVATIRRKREKERDKEKFLPARVPCLRRYPVKTLTWVTRCSGSTHRSGGSPEAFIVLQVYYDRPGISRPTADSIAPRMTTAFSVKTFRAVAPGATLWGTLAPDCTCTCTIGENRKMQMYGVCAIDTAL